MDYRVFVVAVIYVAIKCLSAAATGKKEFFVD